MDRNEIRQIIALLTEHLANHESSEELQKAFDLLTRCYFRGVSHE